MDNIPIPFEMTFGQGQNPESEVQYTNPGWYKCLECTDYGSNCNGPSLGTLGNIASVRAFHKAVKKARKLSLKIIAEAAPTISDNTVNEYFSNAIKDYKWTTVLAIDNALTSICGNRVGMPPLVHACPASSSEVRQQMAAIDLKLAAAELRAAQSETDMDLLRQKLAETKGKHIAQLEQLEKIHEKNTEWLKEDVRLWRRIAFIALGAGFCLLLLVIIYFSFNLFHSTIDFI